MPVLAAVAFAIGFSTHATGRAQAVTPSPRLATEPFVSVGKLIRAGKSRQGSDRFALLDDQGAVSAYVLPTTDAELGRFVNRSVAVTARSMQRGGDSLPYILAQQVSPLGEEVQPLSGSVNLANFETDAQAERALLAVAGAEPTTESDANGRSDDPRILPAGNESRRPAGGTDQERFSFAALMANRLVRRHVRCPRSTRRC